MTGEKPDLEATLRHYGVEVTGLHGNRLVCCPVHDERVPSCSVNLDKGLINCHACGFAGDSITLIQTKEGLGYAASLQFAEAHLGFAGRAPDDRGRIGLSGEAGPARGGYKPRVRRRAGLSSS